jgi:hypothetical protein
MKKTNILSMIIAIAVFLTGCYPHVKYSFNPVESTSQNITIKKSGDQFSDEIISTKITFDNKIGAELIITNKSSTPVKIIWDDSVFIDSNNISHRVIHIGENKINYFTKDLGDKVFAQPTSQIPSIIHPNSTFKEIIVFSDSAVWDGSNWLIKEIFETKYMEDQTPKEKEAINNYLAEIRTKSLKIILPVSIEDSVRTYSFTYAIDAVCTY